MLTKKGLVANAVTVPLNPGLQLQPEKTLTPLLFCGQGRWEQVLLKKGAEVVATTVPLSPGTQVHPLGTLIPTVNVGHRTAEQVKAVGNACENPEQADEDDDMGANPAMQMGATRPPVEPAGHPLTLLEVLEVELFDTAVVVVVLVMLRQLPFASENCPLALQLAMRAIC